MRERSPTQPVPIQKGRQYRRKAAARKFGAGARLLSLAAVVGAAIGAGSLTLSEDTVAAATSTVRAFGVRAGLIGDPATRQGDFWLRCADARAAGAAPIYASQPGYRPQLDRDGDGVACEPYRKF